MKIIPIFEDRLYSAFYEERETLDEFTRLFDCWQDPLFLEEFFDAQESDLKSGFFGSISVLDAITLTQQAAIRLENAFVQLSNSPNESLNAIFRPLTKDSPDASGFEKHKAKGIGNKSWLRLYAIKIQDGVFVVTGGAIKLTQVMGEREHTRDELKKLDRCLSYLREKGIYDIEGFTELIDN